MALSIFSIVLKHLNSIHVLCVSYGSCFTHTLHALLLLSEGRKPCRCRWQKLSPRCGSWTSTLDTCSRGRPGHLLDSGTYAGHHTSLYPHNGGCQILKTCSGDTEAGEGGRAENSLHQEKRMSKVFVPVWHIFSREFLESHLRQMTPLN